MLHKWRLTIEYVALIFREGNGTPLQYSCLENPRDGEPGGLPSMGLHRVGHDWSDLADLAAALILNQRHFYEIYFPCFAADIPMYA